MGNTQQQYSILSIYSLTEIHHVKYQKQPNPHQFIHRWKALSRSS